MLLDAVNRDSASCMWMPPSAEAGMKYMDYIARIHGPIPSSGHPDEAYTPWFMESEAKRTGLLAPMIENASAILSLPPVVQDGFEGGRPFGIVERHKLGELMLPCTMNIFGRRSEASEPEIEVALIIDQSGSVRGKTCHEIVRAATIIHKVMMDRGVVSRAYQYQGAIDTSTVNGAAWRASPEPSHITECSHPEAEFLRQNFMPHGGTPSLECLALVASAMRESQCRHRLILHITDGEPDRAPIPHSIANPPANLPGGNTYERTAMEIGIAPSMRSVVDAAEACGIKTLCLLVSDLSGGLDPVVNPWSAAKAGSITIASYGPERTCISKSADIAVAMACQAINRMIQ